ncbi:MAG: AAA family ATPase [Elusimicrobia bacterium]|nr:AAA family ATPase [Elusimicrobiota bacterium]
MRARMLEARFRETSKSVLLLGPRQVGKTTLCRALNPDFIVNLADEASFVSYSKDPGRLGREVSALAKPSLVLVDEVQRVPALLNSAQAILDGNRGHRFLLTGSSSRKLKRGGANLLPGRIIMAHLDPLSFWELGKDFDLERCLMLGSLPAVYLDSREGADVLETYATVYLREEVRAEALARDIGAYARFLDAVAAASGQWIKGGMHLAPLNGNVVGLWVVREPVARSGIIRGT